ncbi:MAG TPA: hypothetical protein RMI62_13765, partial [Polyangiaceae bacterium LLY-WYZ-15_(1-7)]|nr:hypothetical protein [Polyangiaceae bacterium LLY-WYZ-15_(1-7)]
AVGLAGAAAALLALAAMNARAGAARSAAVFVGLALGAAGAVLMALDVGAMAEGGMFGAEEALFRGGLGLAEALGLPWLLFGAGLGLVFARVRCAERLPPALVGAAVLVGSLDGAAMLMERRDLMGQLLPPTPDWLVFEGARASPPQSASDGHVYPEVFGAELRDGALDSPVGVARLRDVDAAAELLRELSDRASDLRDEVLGPPPQEEPPSQEEMMRTLAHRGRGEVAVALAMGTRAEELVALARAAGRAGLHALRLVGADPDAPTGDGLRDRLGRRVVELTLTPLGGLDAEQPEHVYVTALDADAPPETPIAAGEEARTLGGEERLQGRSFSTLVVVRPGELPVGPLLERVRALRGRGAHVALATGEDVPQGGEAAADR